MENRGTSWGAGAELFGVSEALGDGDAGVWGVFGDVLRGCELVVLEAALRRTSRVKWQISMTG